MGIKSKIKSWFFLDENYDEEFEDEHNTSGEYETKNSHPQQQRANVVSLQKVKNSSKLVIVEPKVFNESQEIADHLKNRKAVVVNLQRIDPYEARRIIDFLSGTVYAIGGEIQKLGTNIILCAPDNVEVTGGISDVYLENQNDESRW